MRSKNGAEQEQVIAAAPKFKARPLNRKILKGPTWPLPKKSTPKLPEFQEFHLRTLERAMQHTSAVSSSSLPCDNSNKGSNNMTVAENGREEESRRASTMDDAKQGRHSTMHLFKARPLNKKVLSSKGDIGVFWNSKKETTVPMEFDLRTKRNQYNTPIELFSKLSLTSELQPNNGSQLRVPQPSSISLKGSKENILNPFANRAQGDTSGERFKVEAMGTSVKLETKYAGGAWGSTESKTDLNWFHF
uniref:TPX2 central domain-containing protein n=1 Tax=Rhizophora mucronata TaxID=61149 RepID=A0A2P2LB51_RHIMU